MIPEVKLQMVGADVEGFLVSSVSGRVRPCVGVFSGTKEKPLPIETLGRGYAIQEDNVMPEYNIPPAADAKEFAQHIYNINIWLRSWVASQLKCDLSLSGSAQFTAADLKSPQAQTFGCEPDFCVWNKSVNPPPKAKSPLLRTAGGHLHMSYTIDGTVAEKHKEYLQIMEHIVKANDLFLAIPSLFVEDDTKRREMYGKAGAFRPKNYGHEYRVLSPWWSGTLARSEWAFHQIQRSVDSLSTGLKFSPALSKAIQKAINTRNIPIASNLVKNFDLEIQQ